MKKKKERLAILAIVMVLVASVAITAYTTGEHRAGITPFVTDGTVHSWPSPVSKAVVWDNGMNYSGLLSAQIDPIEGFDSEPADDFLFEVDQLVNDVHWIGGYWNPVQDGNFDWRITFYNDFGDGTKPGAVIATYLFPNAQVNETLIESTFSYFCSYSVDLPAPLSFMAGMKYWISIQGIGAYKPQSGWAMHDDPILLHQAVFKSVYFEYPDWTNTSDVFGYAVDMCFQLTEKCDWQPGDPHKMHFPQLPDEDGWDVNATQPVVLADDWQCSDSGWVKDIHFWGSWKHGIEGEIIGFWLSIHSNIPADPPYIPYSRPGVTLWELYVEDFDFTPIDPPTMEGWYDPSTGEVIPDDHQAYFQYNICLDEPDWFYQFQDTIYWLNISAVVLEYPDAVWGWKNSEDHFMDDAVWAFWGELNWIDIWEPSTPLSNLFWVAIDPGGVFIPQMSGGTDYYDDGTSINGWYYYEDTYWWNIWFYDHPYDSLRKKVVHIEFDVFELEPGPPSWLTFAVNWSTDVWSIEQPPGDSMPPLPGVTPEELYIGRDILYDGEVVEGHYVFDWEWPDYNPEWVSIDVMGYNFVIPEGMGWIEHDCRGSLDLAFVITGGIECTPSIDVKKKVWDETLQEWVDSTDIDVCNNAEFLITIHNDGTCCDLTNIYVYDFMDSSLEFLDAVPPPDTVRPVPGGTGLIWLDPGPLPPCNTIDITVTAHVVGPACHLDSNYVWAQGDCEEQAVGVYDEDVAYVHATEPPWPNHKMHYPQLPDPEGWDVVATMGYDLHPGIVVADDFMCSKSVPITDIHFWGSWLWDVEAPILGFWLSIHDNVIGPPSHPGEELWSQYITDFEVVPEFPGTQGWYDPFENWWEHPNHNMYFRYDITNIPEPFYQDSGTIYWLNVMADIGPPGYQGYPEPPLWGWKTSLDHWMDDATWSVFMPPYEWIPLYDPITGITLDMAFVITGEEAPVKCGDVNNDGVVDLGDIVYLLNYLYKQPAPAPVPYKCVGDVNNDDVVDLGDIVYLINYLYKQPAPPPNPNCCNPPWAAN